MTKAKALGVWTALALVVGNMIGSGIYQLPATLAPLGRNALIGWGVTILGAMCLAFVFARLSARVPCAGGPYAFAEAAFGPATGFAVAWSYWALLWSGNAAVAVAVVASLSLIFPVLGGGWPAAATALALFWLTTWINIRGVALAGRVQLVTTILKLLPLLAVIGLAAWLIAQQGGGAFAPQPPVPLAPGAIAGAAALTFWGFLGVESATVPADRVENAARLVPLVTIAGTAATGIVYFGVAAAVALLMPIGEVAASPAPVSAFLARSFGPATGQVVALFAAVSAFGAMNGFILLQGEIPRAMARGGVFPAWFGKDGRHGTPVRAQLVSSALATIVCLLNYGGSSVQLFTDIASISLAAGMLAYLVSALAVFRLVPGDRFAQAAAALAAVFVAWMTWGLGLRYDLWALVLLALGLPVYLFVRRGREERQ